MAAARPIETGRHQPHAVIWKRLIDHLHREVSQHQPRRRRGRAPAFLKQTQQITQVGGWEYDVATRRILWTDEVYRIH